MKQAFVLSTKNRKLSDEATSKANEIQKLIFNYLAHYGFRCSGELTFLSENYIEKPASFIQMLNSFLSIETRMKW